MNDDVNFVVPPANKTEEKEKERYKKKYIIEMEYEKLRQVEHIHRSDLSIRRQQDARGGRVER